MTKMTNMKRSVAFLLTLALCGSAWAQSPQGRTLTLEDCHQMAVEQSKDLHEARLQKEMAGYDRKIALANYFPSISATGAYLYNNRDVALISDSQSALLQNAGTLVQGQLNSAMTGASEQLSAAMTQKMTQLMTAIQTNPALAAEYMCSPMWQSILNMLQGVDPSSLAGLVPNVAEPINAIGADIDKTLHPDLHNIWAGAIMVQQPLFVGGKILYSNQMASLAEDLADSKYDMAYADVILDVDQAYWQIISLSNKKELAESYASLLHEMQQDVEHAIAAGVATESDALQIRVKANEADMMLTKATNGLSLSKMLLCKRIGLPLDTDITLSDEQLDMIPEPMAPVDKSLEDIYADRPETRSLDLASRIYDKKAKVVRADMMPTVAAIGAYTLTNPNLYNGLQHSWQGGNLSVGVMVKVPIFHGGEQLYRYRKAKAEAQLYQTQLDDAKEMINLQVSQQRKLMGEAREKLLMSESNLSSAEENLRKAMVGFEAGVVPTQTVLGAQTAWLSAHSECIDAGIELQMAAVKLNQVEGKIK